MQVLKQANIFDCASAFSCSMLAASTVLKRECKSLVEKAFI